MSKSDEAAGIFIDKDGLSGKSSDVPQPAAEPHVDREPKYVSDKDAIEGFEKQSGYKDTMKGREGF